MSVSSSQMAEPVTHTQEVILFIYTRCWGVTNGTGKESYQWLTGKEGRSVPQQGWCVGNVHMSPSTKQWCHTHSASGTE